MLVEQLEERLARQRLGANHARSTPDTGSHQLDSHRRHHRGLPDNGLMTELAHRPGVVDQVIHVDLAWIALGGEATHPGTRAGSAGHVLTEGRRVGKGGGDHIAR